MKKILVASISLIAIMLLFFAAFSRLHGNNESDYCEEYQPELNDQLSLAPCESPEQISSPNIYEEEPAVAPPDYIYEDPPYTPEVLGSPSPPESDTPFEIYYGDVAIPPMSDEERAALEERLRENPPVGFIPRILEDGSMIRLSPDDGSLEILAPDGTRTPLYGATITPGGSIIMPED